MPSGSGTSPPPRDLIFHEHLKPTPHEGGDPHWGNMRSQRDKRPAPFPPQSLVARPCGSRDGSRPREPPRGVSGLCRGAGPGSPRTAPGANGGPEHPRARLTPGERSGAGTGTSPACAISRGRGAPVPAGRPDLS